MGRPKRKISPVKATKYQKLSDFGFRPSNNVDSSHEHTAQKQTDSVNSSHEQMTQKQTVSEEILTSENTKSTGLNDRLKAVAKRSFRNEWKLNRDWLEYDAEKKLMFCRICIKAKLVNSFTTGCPSLKLENIQTHENPKSKKAGENSHTRAVETIKDVKGSETARVKQLAASEAAVVGALKNVAFMAAHDLPNSMLEDLNQLCKEQGAVHLKSLRVDDHTTYEHNSSVQEFQAAIADVITDELIDQINNSPYFSVTLDESTDISVKQNLIVYVRYLSQESGCMVSKNKFFGLVTLEHGATAQHIFEALIECLHTKGVDTKKLSGIATDGAAVMTGHKSGVVERVKDVVPGVLSTHCIAHRLALGSGDAADRIPYLVKFQEIVNALYKYFEYSPKHANNLRQMQEVLDQKQKLQLKQVFHTRWLSFDNALKAVIVNVSSVLSVLLADKSAKAAGLVKSMSTFKFLYTAHFLADVMQQLSRLSKAYQASDIDFSSVHPLLENTVRKISALEDGSGQTATSFMKSVPDAPVESGSISCLFEFEFNGHMIKDSDKQRREAHGLCAQFCRNVVDNLQSRFDPTGDSKILSAVCQVFRPDVISTVHEKRDAVLVHVETVANHFKSVHENESTGGIATELMEFLEFVNSNTAKLTLMNSVDDVCQYAIREKTLFPVVADTALRFLTAPVSTVECERGFSRQNLIKTKTRNCLKTVTLENLMRISICKPGNEFRYDLAFKKWVDVKKRRIM